MRIDLFIVVQVMMCALGALAGHELTGSLPFPGPNLGAGLGGMLGAGVTYAGIYWFRPDLDDDDDKTN